MQYNAVVSPFSDTKPIWACLQNKVPIPWFIMMFPLKMAILGNPSFSDLPIFPYIYIYTCVYIYIYENHWTQMKMLDPMAAQVLWNSPDICLIRGSPRRASQFLCRLRCHQTWPRDPRTKRACSYKVNAEIIYWRMFHVLVQVWLPRASSQRFALRAFGNPGRISSKFLPKIIAPVEYGLFGNRHSFYPSV